MFLCIRIDGSDNKQSGRIALDKHDNQWLGVTFDPRIATDIPLGKPGIFKLALAIHRETICVIPKYGLRFEQTIQCNLLKDDGLELVLKTKEDDYEAFGTHRDGPVADGVSRLAPGTFMFSHFHDSQDDDCKIDADCLNLYPYTGKQGIDRRIEKCNADTTSYNLDDYSTEMSFSTMYKRRPIVAWQAELVNSQS